MANSTNETRIPMSTTPRSNTEPRLEPCPKCGDCLALTKWKDAEVSCGRCGFNAPHEAWNSRVSASTAPVVDEAVVSYGVQIIAKERQRHFDVEGWTPEHDDHHTDQSLAQAAACYAWPSPRPLEVKKAWPWELRDWKPELYRVPGATEDEKREARIRVLAKAGALVAAEIDRLARIDGITTTTLPPTRVGEQEHVAWCRYTFDESGAIQTIETCDSDAKGAFKVYR